MRTPGSSARATRSSRLMSGSLRRERAEGIHRRGRWPGAPIRLAWGVIFARLTGQQHGASYSLSAWLVRRAVALVYLIAFGSLAVQWRGLWGRTGILPAGEFLGRVKELLG